MNSAGMSAQDTFGNAFIFAFAGHDTTGHTLTFLAYELARQPLIQERLRQEVNSWFQAIESQKRDITYTDLANLPFMTRCWTETLRLWPAVTNGTFRELQVNDYVHSKFKGSNGEEQLVDVPKGTLINIPNWPRHRNPDLWGPDATEFNPDREFRSDEIWNGDVFRAYNPATERFSPFTFGPRDCIGKNFAHMEARLIMAHVLRSFRLELSDAYVNMDRSKFLGVNYGTMGPQDMTLDDMVKAIPGYGPPLRRPTGLPIHVVPLDGK
jgi:cytochrome P450